MTEPVIPAIPKPTRKVLSPTMLKKAEYEAPAFFVIADNDVTLDDIMRPAFWAHHAGSLRKHNTIDIVRDNGSLDVQVRVTSVGQGFVHVRPIRVWEDEEVAAARLADDTAADAPGANVAIPEEYKITSGRGSFTVTYVPTDTRIASGLKTRAAAVEAVREHAKSAGIAWPETEAA